MQFLSASSCNILHIKALCFIKMQDIALNSFVKFGVGAKLSIFYLSA